MPFNCLETITGLRHVARAIERVCLNRPADHYIGELAKQDVPIKSSELRCPMCGFAMANVEIGEGWLIQGCSANGIFEPLVKNSGRERRLSTLRERLAAAMLSNDASHASHARDAGEVKASSEIKASSASGAGD